jgi:hypothetical protein
MKAADDPRWADDPSLSWDDIAPDWPFHLDTPDDPSGDVDVIAQKLWPDPKGER